MKPYKEQEFNRLCAEFIGWEYIPKDAHPYAFLNYGWWIKDTYYQDIDPSNNSNWKGFNSSMKFHSDWNWIMEVVRKIISLRNRSNLFKEVYGEVYRFQHTCLDDIIDINILASKIWQFINWYNEKNKQYVYN